MNNIKFTTHSVEYANAFFNRIGDVGRLIGNATIESIDSENDSLTWLDGDIGITVIPTDDGWYQFRLWEIRSSEGSRWSPPDSWDATIETVRGSNEPVAFAKLAGYLVERELLNAAAAHDEYEASINTTYPVEEV